MVNAPEDVCLSPTLLILCRMTQRVSSWVSRPQVISCRRGLRGANQHSFNWAYHINGGGWDTHSLSAWLSTLDTRKSWGFGKSSPILMTIEDRRFERNTNCHKDSDSCGCLFLLSVGILNSSAQSDLFSGRFSTGHPNWSLLLGLWQRGCQLITNRMWSEGEENHSSGETTRKAVSEWCQVNYVQGVGEEAFVCMLIIIRRRTCLWNKEAAMDNEFPPMKCK